MSKHHHDSEESAGIGIALGRNLYDGGEVRYDPEQGPLLVMGHTGGGKSEAAKTLFSRLLDRTSSPVVAIDGMGQGYSRIALSHGGQRAYGSGEGLMLDPEQPPHEQEGATAKALCIEIPRNALSWTGMSESQPGVVEELILEKLAASGPTHLFVDPLDIMLSDCKLIGLLGRIWARAAERRTTVAATVTDPRILVDSPEARELCRRPHAVLWVGPAPFEWSGRRLITPPERELLSPQMLTIADGRRTRARSGDGILEGYSGEITQLRVDKLEPLEPVA